MQRLVIATRLSLIFILLTSIFSHNLQARKIIRNVTGFNRIRYQTGYYHRNLDGNSGGSRYYLNCYLPDIDAIACVDESSSDRIRIIDRKSGEIKNAILLQQTDNEHYIYPLAYDKNNGVLIIDGFDYIDLKSGKKINDFGNLSQKGMGAKTIKITSDGKSIIGLFYFINGQLYGGNYKRSTIYKIDYQTGAVVDSFPQKETIYDFVLDEANNRLITYCKDEKIYIWDYLAKKIIKTINYDCGSSGGGSTGFYQALLYLPKNNDQLVIYIEDGNPRIIVYDLKKQKALYSWKYDNWSIRGLALAETKNEVCYNLNDKAIIRDLTTGQIINTFEIPFLAPLDFLYVNNDKDLLIDNYDGTIFNYNFESKELRAIAPFRNKISSFCQLDNNDIIVFNSHLESSDSKGNVGWVLTKESNVKNRFFYGGFKFRKNTYNEMNSIYSMCQSDYQFTKIIPGTRTVLYGESPKGYNTITAWDMDKDVYNQLNLSSKLEFTDLQFDDNEKNIAYISSTDSSIYKYDLSTNSVVDVFKTDRLVTRISKKLDNKIFFVSDTAWHYSLNVYDINSHSTQKLINCKGWQFNTRTKYEEINLMPRYEFSNDVRYFAYSIITSYDKTNLLNIVDLTDLSNIDKPFFSKNIGASRVTCMDFSEDNKFLAVGCFEKWLLINLETQTIREFPLDFAGKIPFFPQDLERRINRIKFTDKDKITYVTSEPSLIEEDISEYMSAPEPVQGKIFNLEVFPNPSEGQFSIEFTPRSLGSTRIRVTNLLGETVYERTEFLPVSAINEVTIDLKNCSTGTYYITVINGNDISNSHVLIKN